MARIAKAKGETTHTEKSSNKTYTRLVEELKALEAQKDALAKEIEAASGAAAPVVTDALNDAYYTVMTTVVSSN